jgi:hypothetical protein
MYFEPFIPPPSCPLVPFVVKTLFSYPARFPTNTPGTNPSANHASDSTTPVLPVRIR